jgi:hypothetical protein
MNWGTGIAIVYSTFAIGMVSAVVTAARRHDPGLVQKNYYELDIRYQERIDRRQNAAGLTESPTVQYDAAAAVVRITFPEALPPANGHVLLYRSADNKSDLAASFSQKKVVEVPLKTAASWRWHAEITWSAGGVDYFNEATF